MHSDGLATAQRFSVHMLPASKMHNLPQISESLDELETLVREERDAPSQPERTRVGQRLVSQSQAA
jgi:hypothetical protein